MDAPKLCVNEEANKFLTEKEDHRRFLIIEVVDTGLGMDEKDRKELFTKFATGNNSRGLNTNGLGLGLYLSKEICKKLEGDISCESIAGIGSTFMVKVPFDSKFELKDILENDYKLFKSPASKWRTGLDYPNEYFDEFSNVDSKDGTLNDIDSKYNFKITSSIFIVNQSEENGSTRSNNHVVVKPPVIIESVGTSTTLNKRGTDSKFELDLIKT